MAPALIVGEVALVVLLGTLFWNSTRGDWLDRMVGQHLYASPGSVARAFFVAVSALGVPGVAIAASVLIGLVVWKRFNNVLLAAFCPLAVTLATTVESLVKGLVHRARPTTAALAHLYGRSFPSGHATASTALALAVAILVVAVGSHGRDKLLVLAVAYAVAVCLSRIVLGVHYLTDVVAGMAVAGAVVLSVALVLAQLAARRMPPDRHTHRTPVG